jgi:hypothetical protein
MVDAVWLAFGLLYLFGAGCIGALGTHGLRNRAAKAFALAVALFWPIITIILIIIAMHEEGALARQRRVEGMPK